MIIIGHASVLSGCQLENSMETRPVPLFKTTKTVGLPPLLPSLHRPARTHARLGLVCNSTNTPQPLSTYTIAEDIARDHEGLGEVQFTAGNVPEHTASLARSFVLLKPTSQIIRRVLPRKSVSTRPVSFAAVILTTAMYVLMAARTYISDQVRSCKTCGGFGIKRCDLCEGHRVIFWEGKYKHTQPCPKCFGKRYVKCNQCFGVFGKSIFAHKSCKKITISELRRMDEEAEVDEKWVGAPKWVI